MIREYRTVEEIVSPLIMVRMVENVTYDELVEVELDNDVLRIDGNMAVAWSAGLQFTVEKATSSLMGSALSGEGLVNVYRGTGKVLLCPFQQEAGAMPVQPAAGQ